MERVEVELAPRIMRNCVRRRAFAPHITLARWNRRNAEAVDVFLRRNGDLHSEPFMVEQFILFESKLSRHGAHYDEIASFDLR